MDLETNAEMIFMMGLFINKINRVHLNNILDIQNKDFKDLPMMPKHIDNRNKKSVLCYRKALGFCPGN